MELRQYVVVPAAVIALVLFGGAAVAQHHSDDDDDDDHSPARISRAAETLYKQAQQLDRELESKGDLQGSQKKHFHHFLENVEHFHDEVEKNPRNYGHLRKDFRNVAKEWYEIHDVLDHAYEHGRGDVREHIQDLSDAYDSLVEMFGGHREYGRGGGWRPPGRRGRGHH